MIKFIRTGIIIGGISFTIILSACKGDDIDVPDVPLAGKIGGVDWEYKMGNSTLISADFKYKFLLLSTKELGDDPCPIISSSNPHLQMILPLQSGDYSIPLPVFDESVKFVLGNGTVLSATAGFITIIAIDPDTQQLVGYIDADFDDDNQVSGTFIVELC
ncbi:MAG: hypothetical protein GY816_06285 [Cytophagales bacterium]|nr:hypothetical protein [Cytophagales bacterium]